MKATETVSLDFLSPSKLEKKPGLQWVIRRLMLARRIGNVQEVRRLSERIPDGALERWLFSPDDRLTALLVETLHDERLRPFLPRLLLAWRALPGATAGEVARRLARLVPSEMLWEVERWVATNPSYGQCKRTWSTLKALQIIGLPARDCVERIARQQRRRPLQDALTLTRLFRVGISLKVEAVGPLLQRYLLSRGGNDMECQLALFDAFNGVEPASPLFEVALRSLNRSSGQPLSTLPEFFQKEAPLEVLDNVLFHGKLPLEQVHKWISQIPSRFQRHLAATLWEIPASQVHPRVHRLIVNFIVALYGGQFLNPNCAFGGTRYQRLLELTAARLSVLPFEDRLLDAVVARFVPKRRGRFETAFRESLDSPALPRLVRLLRRLPLTGRESLFVDSLSRDANEESAMQAIYGLVEGGRRALTTIEKRWSQGDFLQQLQMLDAIEGIATPAAARLLIRLYPSVRSDSTRLEAWLFAATHIPSTHLRNFLFRQQHRDTPGLDVAYRELRDLLGEARISQPSVSSQHGLNG